MKPKLKLLEIGKQFEPIVHDVMRTKDGRYAYARERALIVDKGVHKIPSETVFDSAKALMERYPEKGYYYQGNKLGRTLYYLLGREVKGETDIPIYYAPKRRKFFIQESHAKKSRELASKIVMMRLYALKIPYKMRTLSSKRLAH